MKNNDGEHGERPQHGEDKKTGTMRETGRRQRRDNKDRDRDQTRTTGTISIKGNRDGHDAEQWTTRDDTHTGRE